MSSIHINPANKGKFNALKKRTGKSTEELTHSKNPLTRKRAIFAQNAKHFKHASGGYLSTYPLGGNLDSQTKDELLALKGNNIWQTVGNVLPYVIKKKGLTLATMGGIGGAADMMSHGRLSNWTNEHGTAVGTVGGAVVGTAAGNPMLGMQVGSQLGSIAQKADAQDDQYALDVENMNKMNGLSLAKQRLMGMGQPMQFKIGGFIPTYPEGGNMDNNVINSAGYRPFTTQNIYSQYTDPNTGKVFYAVKPTDANLANPNIFKVGDVYGTNLNPNGGNTAGIDYNPSVLTHYGDTNEDKINYPTGYEDYINKIKCNGGKMAKGGLLEPSNGMYKKGGWIQKAVNPKHKGYCTPMTKSTCTPRRKAFAMTMKKHHGFHKKAEGGSLAKETMYKDNMTYYATGGTHESNKFGGVRVGNKGLVEQGEFRYKDYVFSNRF